MNNKKNAISSLFFQLTTIVQGLVLPRLILVAFGSETNGLVSSAAQVLSFISLLEGGLGAVVLAELYKPVEEKDDEKIQSILNACQSFFSILTVLFLVYTLLAAFIYPRFVNTNFSDEYISLLILILSMTTAAQYLFSITYRLLLQAEQKLYIVNCISAFTVLLNTISSVLIVCVFPSVHMVKLWSGIIYLVQPLAYRAFVEKKFLRSGTGRSNSRYALKNRWSGFAQNLAHFVNMNTDVVVITIFMPLQYVSVYSVHLLVINALRGIISSVGNSYQSALGKYIAVGNCSQLKANFARFERAFWLVGMIVFFCCTLLIDPFVQIYTAGIDDAAYYQPAFSFILVLANMFYVFREPYRLLVLAGGKFKETNFGAVAESVLNLVLSLLLVGRFGLAGVAAGTLIAISFRLCSLIWYLRRDFLKRSYTSLFPYIATFFLLLLTNLAVYTQWPLKLGGIFHFLLAGCVVFGAESVLCILVYWTVRKIFEPTRRKQ